MKVVLLSLSKTSHTLLIGYHHIILDGVGLQIFLKDLEQAYMGKTLQRPEQQYSEFSRNQLRAISSGQLENIIEYWRKEHAKPPPCLPLLPVSKVSGRKTMETYKACPVQQRLDARLVGMIKRVCRESHVTTSHFYLATFQALLARLTKMDDICIGLVDANRDAKSMSTVGLFLNMLPLRFKASLSQDFGSMLRGTRDKVYSALAHGGVPFDELLKGMRYCVLTLGISDFMIADSFMFTYSPWLSAVVRP